MRNTIALVAAGLLATTLIQPSRAADLDYQPMIQELVVSGMIESWTGYTFIGSNDRDDDLSDYFNGQRSLRLSLPLGSNLSIQMDADSSLNSSWLFDDGDDYEEQLKYAFQGVGHLSWRDPSTGLIGVFGAVGTANGEDKVDFNVIGGEAQLYLTDFTIYGQGGYLDGDGDQLKNAGFGRGVLRWFTTEDSRLQGEVSYVSGDDGEDDLTVLEWAARYDTVLSGLPIIGDTNVFVGYRGARFDNSDDGKYFDHTVMIGFRTWFGGNTMREFDRVGATLDAPDFGRWSVSD